MTTFFKLALLVALVTTPVAMMEHMNGDGDWMPWAVLLVIDISCYLFRMEVK